MDFKNWILNAPMSKAQCKMFDCHVLLVDHDSDTDAPLIDMFEYFSYKVTSVRFASNALSILSQGGQPKFDLVIENIKSPDTCGYKLLQAAIKMDIPVILLLDEDDAVLTRRALDNGVLLCVTRPVQIETVTLLWQHVLRERIRKQKEKGQLGGLMAPNRLNERVGEGYAVRGYLSDYTSSDENSFEHQDICRFGRKIWIEWTEELHAKFMDAVRKLGQGRCYPKQILELMNVPGLTRMQVASHLQKCRRGTWQNHNQRKPRTATFKTTSTKTGNPVKTKRYGAMPILAYKSQPPSYIQKNHLNNQDANVPGCNIEGLSPHDANGFNLFSDYGVETKNTEYSGQTSMPDGKFPTDVAPVGNASLDESKAADEYFEFVDIDSLMQNFCVSEQEQLDYDESWDAIDLDALYSDQVPIMLETKIKPCNKTSTKPGETEVLKMGE